MAATTLLLFAATAHAVNAVDITNAAIVIRGGELPNAEAAAATILAEECLKRTRVPPPVLTTWPEGGAVVAITSQRQVPEWGREIPQREGDNLPETRPEGYRLFVENGAGARPVVWIIGADPRGTLYGVGALLRNFEWDPRKPGGIEHWGTPKVDGLFDSLGTASIRIDLDIATAPAYPIRGHQLGFRAKANSWDAWDVAQFDQYIRELAFFGINSIENIPFQDQQASPLMKVPRREMNRQLSAICERYGLDYWVWTPATFDLTDQEARAKALDKHEELYRDCTKLTGVFFPGGDPGDNPPELVLPFLADIARRLGSIHPEARVWLSLQGFNPADVNYVFEYLERESPDWLGGLVGGPSAPPIPMMRRRLPEKYQYRLYPDITHNKLCQYPVPWWDQALALTLGREAINPRPVQYAYIHNWFAPYSDGFISYSDGVHDDVNKAVWSALSWDPATPVRKILREYARVFFHPIVAELAADGLFALEKNWRGALIDNGSVEGTLILWRALEQQTPLLAGNWRWQMCLVRAYYDAYTHRRLIYETGLEGEANAVLLQAEDRGADTVMTEAVNTLNSAVSDPISPDLRKRVEDLCQDLFESCALQTSVEKYHASSAERGAFLDFIDYPLNNRWWLEDEFAKIRQIESEAEKCERLHTIATWEHPGPGSYYDDVGNAAKSPHVLRCEEVVTEPGEEAHPEPTHWWWDEGKSRARLSWQTSMNWPLGVVYEGLDPHATYTVRLTGYGKSLLRMDGKHVQPTLDGREIGEFKEFHVPAEHIQDRKLVLTWDMPLDEAQLNWRQQSRLSEIWLLKN